MRTPLVATGDVLYHAPHRRPAAGRAVLRARGLHHRHCRPRTDGQCRAPSQMARQIARLFRGFEDAFARTFEIAEACASRSTSCVMNTRRACAAGKTPRHIWRRWRGRGSFPLPRGDARDCRIDTAAGLTLIDPARLCAVFPHRPRHRPLCPVTGISARGAARPLTPSSRYRLSITAVDPDRIDLLFERFVSPERKEPPDIDVDLEHDRREEVIQSFMPVMAVTALASPATVISYRARSAVRDWARPWGSRS